MYDEEDVKNSTEDGMTGMGERKRRRDGNDTIRVILDTIVLLLFLHYCYLFL
jgi:hypothetical protein